MQPLGDKILLKSHPPEAVTRGGIIIPESSKKRPGKGTIVFTSIDKDVLVKPGDEVLYNPDAGAPLFHNEEEHLMITYSDIWAINP